MEYLKMFQIANFVFCLFHYVPRLRNAGSPPPLFPLSEAMCLLSSHSSQSLTESLTSGGWEKEKRVCEPPVGKGKGAFCTLGVGWLGLALHTSAAWQIHLSTCREKSQQAGVGPPGVGAHSRDVKFLLVFCVDGVSPKGQQEGGIMSLRVTGSSSCHAPLPHPAILPD